MKRMTTTILVALMCLAMAAPLTAGERDCGKKPLIQIAILLDTSNSMDGLIHQAKSQLWKIVNEFVLAKRNGVRPDIQVALYEYGNDNLPAKEGYIRQVLPFTTDLDKVSEKLFALTTNGGLEYCGQVIDVAKKQLDWSKEPNDLKVMVIAGNEPFTQGPVDYRDSCKSAISKGIIVNTIHCGPYDEGARTGWKDGAVLADGTYIHIDQDAAVVHIDAPQDKEIAELGAKLNNTYIPYGRTGTVAAERQMAQDSNASSVAPGSMVNRAVFKSSKQYRNTGWDLVDAVHDGTVKVADLDEEELPEGLKGKSKAEIKEVVDAKQKEREKIQKKITKLNEERRKYVEAEEKKRAAEAGKETFDSALIKSVREQAAEHDFDFE